MKLFQVNVNIWTEAENKEEAGENVDSILKLINVVEDHSIEFVDETRKWKSCQD